MCTQIEIIDQAIEFMESHLRSRVTIAQIAEQSGYSLFYFIRTFNKVVQQTPYDYLVTRRVSEALKMITETDRRITDIALDFCFETPESFSRAFKRMFGILPSLCRKESVPEDVFPVPPRTLQDLQFINRSDFALPELMEFEEMTLIGLSSIIDAQDCEKGIDQTEQLRMQLAGYLKERKTKIVSVWSYNDHWKQDFLFKGIATEKGIEAFPPLIIQRIPSGKYARIFYRANDQQAALHYLLYTWLPQNSCKQKYRFMIEEESENTNSEMERAIRIPVLMI
jgi:AraC-like DNA-binding protein